MPADRLWIQRAPPRAPRPPKRKRPAPKQKPKKIVHETSSEDELPTPPTKRTRTRAGNRGTSTPASTPNPPTSNPRARKAKLQANQRLDAQYKELEAFQREAAVQTSRATPTRSAAINGTSTRASARRVLGTRASRRLRGADEDEDEWQEVPQEWLNDKESEGEVVTRGKRAVNGKAKATEVGKAKAMRLAVEEAVDEMDEDEQDKTEGEEDLDDAMSELTELSELTPEPEEDAPEEEEVKTKTARSKRKAPVTRKTKGKARAKPKVKIEKVVKEELIEEEEPEPEPEPDPPLPADFLEWEAVCILFTFLLNSCLDSSSRSLSPSKSGSMSPIHSKRQHTISKKHCTRC